MAISLTITVIVPIQNRSSRLLISRDFLPESGTTGHLRDALRNKRFSGTSGTTALRVRLRLRRCHEVVEHGLKLCLPDRVRLSDLFAPLCLLLALALLDKLGPSSTLITAARHPALPHWDRVSLCF